MISAGKLNIFLVSSVGILYFRRCMHLLKSEFLPNIRVSAHLMETTSGTISSILLLLSH